MGGDRATVRGGGRVDVVYDDGDTERGGRVEHLRHMKADGAVDDGVDEAAVQQAELTEEAAKTET